jgi:hypothetical protein
MIDLRGGESVEANSLTWPGGAGSDTSPTYSDISNNEATTNQTQAGNSSASATITITMIGVLDE